MTALQWVSRDATVRSGSRAVAALLRSSSFGWALIGVAIDLPVVRVLSGAGTSELPDGHPDELAIGTEHLGRTPSIRSILLHDRHVPMPEPEAPLPEVLTQTAHGACLSVPKTPDSTDRST